MKGYFGGYLEWAKLYYWVPQKEQFFSNMLSHIEYHFIKRTIEFSGCALATD